MDKAEIKLIQKIQSGDASALRLIIDKYQAPLERYLRRIGVKDHDIDDVMQNTFLKAYVNINSFNCDKGKFSSWVYRIAHNESITFLKKSGRSAITVDDDTLWEVIESAEDISLDTDKLKLREAVSDAISKLDQKYAEPIVLHYIEGKSYQEISYILKIPVSSVGVRISRAKLKLKNLLKKWKKEASYV